MPGRFPIGAPITILVASLCGCGGEDATRPGSGGGGGQGGSGGGGGDSPCAPGELLLDDDCVPAGLPADWTAPGPSEEPTPGVPEGECGEGFSSDGLGGCTPILPPAPCTGLDVAIPGDAQCRPIADCGSGPWGDIPTGAATIYVDASFAGTPDGSAANPYPTIGAAVDAAVDGTTIAVAAGSYAEDVLVDGKTLALWGRCPELVEIVGVTEPWALAFFDAPGASLHTIGVTGPHVGVAFVDSPGGQIDRVYAHDTGEPGIAVAGFGEEVLIADSLTVDTGIAGIYVLGAAAVERCEARATSSAIAMRGIGTSPQSGTTRPPALRVEQTHVHHTTGVGIFGNSAALDIRRTVVADTTTDGTNPGWGLFVSDQDGPPGSLELYQSVIARNTEANIIVVGVLANLDAVTVEQGQAGANGYGQALWATDGLSANSQVTVARSVFRDHVTVGLGTESSSLDASEVLVQRVLPNPLSNVFGIGVLGNGVAGAQGPSEVALTGSIVEEVTTGGVTVYGSVATVADSVIRDVREVGDGTVAAGVFGGLDETMVPSSVEVRRSRVEGVEGVGLAVIGSSLEVSDSEVSRHRSISLSTTSDSGIGVTAVGRSGAAAQLTVDRCLVEGNEGRGVVVASGALSMSATLVRDIPAALGIDGNGQGRGIELQLATGTIRQSEVAEVASAGVMAASSGLTLEGLWAHDVAVDAEGSEGFGIVAADVLDLPAGVSCTGCRLDRLATAGALAHGSVMTLDAVLIADLEGDAEGDFGRGVVAQHGAQLSATHCRIERVQEAGAHFIDSEGSLTSITIEGVAAEVSSGLYGDGIIAALSSPIAITDSRIGQVARAAVGSFGSTISLTGNDLRCNPLALDAEDYGGQSSSLVDLGGNLCGCGDQPSVCKAVSTGLAPPEALPEAETDAP